MDNPNVPSPILVKEPEVKLPEYSDDEKKYFKKVTLRMSRARNELNQPHDEFDGMNYLQYCEENRKGANTYIEPKKNKTDTNFASGTIRNKMLTYLSSVNNLDLANDISAFDDNNQEIRQLGEAMENIVYEVGERDGEGGDEEKKLLRQYNLFEQGTVFVRETFASKYKIKKKINKTFNGKIDSAQWTKQLTKVYEGCTRQIILNENVLPGNIRQFEQNRQPFFADIDVMPYEEAKQIYGEWERWQNVPKSLTDILQTNRDAGKLYNPFKLYQGKNNTDVEIIRYQDIFANEMMIFINGVMMMPIGFPMPLDEYDVAKQVNEIISPFFYFGKSMVFRLRNNAILIDELMRLAIKKTQQSFAPPLINTSGRTFSQRIFAPGMITSGIKPGTIAPLLTSPPGINNSEVEMIQMLQNKIDEKSTNPVFGGQQPNKAATATQILEVQKQAKMMLNLVVFACSMLEYKLGWLRIKNILANWFKPKGKFYNEYTGDFINRYNSVSREKLIEGVGVGRNIVKVMDKKNIPSIDEQIQQEDQMSTSTSPVRITYLDPEYVTSSKLFWMINVVPKEKKSDALSKVLFNEFMQGAMVFPNANLDYLSERYAENWEENPAKVFNKPQPPASSPDQTPPGQTPSISGQANPGQPPAGAGANNPGIPKMPLPKQRSSALLNMAAQR